MRKRLIMAIFLILLLGFGGTTFAATTHTVQPGESYWKIAVKYGVPVSKLMATNNASNSALYAGQIITIPSSTLTSSEKDLLARLVEAEAKGEPYAGKVAVATVVLNRVDSNLFPNSVYSVIYQADQFTPVKNGEINKPATNESKQAVNEALAFRGQGNGSLYFFNPSKTSNTWLRSKPVTVVIGSHIFAK